MSLSSTSSTCNADPLEFPPDVSWTEERESGSLMGFRGTWRREGVCGSSGGGDGKATEVLGGGRSAEVKEEEVGE